MFLTKPSLANLERALEDKAEGYQDLTVNPEYLDAVETAEGTVFDVNHPDIPEKKIVTFSDSALGQLLNKIGIPIAFWKKCPSHLQVPNFSHFNMEYEKDYLMRFNHHPQKNHIRAVLSDRYSVIDDLDLFKILFDVLRDRTDISYRLMSWDDRITQLSIDFNDCTGEHDGRTYTAGLSITNSETGHSSVWVEPVVHTGDISFYNRRVLKGQGCDCRVVHRGTLAEGRIQPMVEKAKEIAQVGVVQLAEAFQTTISRDHALRAIDSIDSLPSRFVAILEEEWAEEQEIIKGEAARRVLLFAKELPLFQRISVQQAAGRITGLFSGYKQRFADLAKEISDD